MRKLIELIFLLSVPLFLQSQERLPNNILLDIQKATNDSMKFAANQAAVYYFVELNRDSLHYYINECLRLAQKNNEELEEAWAFASKGYYYTGMGEYSQAFTSLLNAFALIEDPKSEKQKWIPPGQTGRQRRLYYLSYTHHLYAILMGHVKNYEQAIFHFKLAKKIADEQKVSRGVIWADMNLGSYYLELNKIDSSLLFSKQAKDLALKTPGETKYLGKIISTLGNLSLKLNDTAKAIQLFKQAIAEAKEHKNNVSLTYTYGHLAKLYFLQNKDSGLWYARKALESSLTIGKNSSYLIDLGVVYYNLFLGYQLNNQHDSALKYAALALTIKDSINNKEISNLADFQKMSLDEQLRLQNLEKEKITYQNKIRIYALLAGLVILSIIGFILYRNNKKEKKAKIVLEKTLKELKSTQSQLIQSEKMASLGELTAGIAHEIQNPLNFVNNFSEVNTELVEELQSALASNNMQQAIVIADDIKENEQKINHHGKRADAIVKGMLQHSRNNSGQKEPTDINALADEYLRLAYHGLRAKDGSFNATLKTHYNDGIGKINVVPQDMGRVILNLITNAFYAVNERLQKAKSSGDNNYEPTVTVSTKKSEDTVQISVKDNGNGIPQKVLDKMFQPFFTTKPTGEGTGLGLSLSYDIVKAHGGEIKVATKEGEGAEFVINIPMKKGE